MLIDLAKGKVSYNGGAELTIPKAAGPIYFMMVDGSSVASGSGEVNFGNSAFDKAVRCGGSGKRIPPCGCCP